MASIREQVVVAIVARLDGAGKPAGLRVHRNRALAINHDKLPASVVYPISDSADVASHDLEVEHQLLLRIEHRVEVTGTDAEPDKAIDPLYVWGVQSIMTDQRLGGLSIAIDEGPTEWDEVALDRVYGAAVTDFTITYCTTQKDPEVSP